MTMFQQIQNHPLFSLALWLILSGVINMLLRTRTPEQWVALGEAKPRVAALIRVVRAVGLDPAKLIEAAADIVNSQARPARAKVAAVTAAVISEEKKEEENSQ